MMKIICYIFVILIAGVAAHADTDFKEQQSDLKKIQQEVDSNRKKLDSLKNVEGKLNRSMNESDQKIRTDKKVSKRLKRERDNLKKEIANTEDSLAVREEQLDFKKRRYLGNVRQLYLATHNREETFSENPNEELVLLRQQNYLTALTGFEYENVELAKVYLNENKEMIDQLSSERKSVNRLMQKKNTSISLEQSKKKKKQRDLATIQRKKAQISDRIGTLGQQMQELEAIVARLQKEAEERHIQNSNDGGPSFFSSLKGSLSSPYRGEIIDWFGNKVDKITKLKSFSSGILIKNKPFSRVSTVASGTVAYVGTLRGYGNFVIMNHDDKYFTTYAGLGKTVVIENEYILSGNKIAVSDETGVVKFELRQGKTPLDPMEWLRLDSF